VKNILKNVREMAHKVRKKINNLRFTTTFFRPGCDDLARRGRGLHGWLPVLFPRLDLLTSQPAVGDGLVLLPLPCCFRLGKINNGSVILNIIGMLSYCLLLVKFKIGNLFHWFKQIFTLTCSSKLSYLQLGSECLGMVWFM
jgi:hypothetical protein